MASYTIMSYNIEHMNSLFSNNQVKADKTDKAQAIAAVITARNPHVLGICEAANALQEHEHFIANFLPGSGYKVALGASRGGQNLVFYFRDPFKKVSVDSGYAYYKNQLADLENIGIKEQYRWERRPLEAVFKVGANGPKIRFIMVHSKSKGIFSVVDLHQFQAIAQANRKRLIGQALQLRERLNDLITGAGAMPTIVMGDFNDGPGMDPYERKLGRSFVETVTGSVYEPDKTFHNTLYWMSRDSTLKKHLWTVDFPDPIVSHHAGWKHRVWLDHILVSPDMLDPNNTLRYSADSGTICPKDNNARKASDHFGVYCTIQD